MADKTVTVRPSGGTYTTLAAAITGEVTANADLTAAGMNGILTISIEGDWSGGADTAQVNVNGFTVDATHYVRIVCDTANHASTSWDTSKYILNPTGYSGYALTLSEYYTRIEGLQIVPRTDYSCVSSIAGNLSILSGCYLKATGLYVVNDRNCTIVNCILDGGDTAAYFKASGGGTGSKSTLLNCVFINSGGYGIRLNATYYSDVKNCYAGNNTGADLSEGTAGAMALTTTYSEDGSLSTSTAAYSTDTFTSVTSGSEDFSLVSGSDLIGAGTDLSADATYPFDWDITGATRTTWDVGAAYYASAVAFFFKRLKRVLLRR